MSERYDPHQPGIVHPGRFYDGSPGRTLVECPDCQQEADPVVGGDHGLTCLQRFGYRAPKTVDPVRFDAAVQAGVVIIRHAAGHQRLLSANSTRAMMDNAGIPATARSAAFRAAVREGLVEYCGYVASTEVGPHAHKHQVREYWSLIYRPRAARR